MRILNKDGQCRGLLLHFQQTVRIKTSLNVSRMKQKYSFHNLVLVTVHKIIRWLRLEVTSGGHLVQHSSSRKATSTGSPRLCADSFLISVSIYLHNLFRQHTTTTCWPHTMNSWPWSAQNPHIADP